MTPVKGLFDLHMGCNPQFENCCFIPLCGFWILEADLQAVWQAPFPAEPSHWCPSKNLEDGFQTTENWPLIFRPPASGLVPSQKLRVPLGAHGVLDDLGFPMSVNGLLPLLFVTEAPTMGETCWKPEQWESSSLRETKV